MRSSNNNIESKLFVSQTWGNDFIIFSFNVVKEKFVKRMRRAINRNRIIQERPVRNYKVLIHWTEAREL